MCVRSKVYKIHYTIEKISDLIWISRKNLLLWLSSVENTSIGVGGQYTIFTAILYKQIDVINDVFLLHSHGKIFKEMIFDNDMFLIRILIITNCLHSSISR